MKPNGSFPLELARTRPYSYSLFNLDIMTTLCRIASPKDEDLLKFSLPDGRGIAKAIAFMYPLYQGQEWMAVCARCGVFR
jgi:Alginate lyase